MGFAAVDSGVGPRHVGDGQGAAVAVLGDPDGLVGVVVDHAAVVEPEDVEGRLRGLLGRAVEAHRVPLVEVQLRVAFDNRSSLCGGKKKKNENLLMNQ